MVEITCTVDISGVDDAANAMKKVLRDTIQLVAQDYSDEVKREITNQHLIDHGNMKNSVLPVLMLDGAQVVSGVKYLPFLNDGTGIYGKHRTPIVPRNKKALVFEYNGQTFVRKSVKGVKAHHFVEKAFEPFENGQRVPALFRRALRMNGLQGGTE